MRGIFRKAINALLWAALAALVMCAPLVWARLPATGDGAAAKKYEGFAGVLRLWVCEGWQPGAGSLKGWLDECAAAFERKNDGCYVEATYVDADELASFRTAELPPDALLFAPSMLDSGEGLISLEIKGASGPYAECGLWRGEARAVPVALGGYALMINERRLDGLPEVWGEAGAELIDLPMDGAYNCWSAALIALMANESAEDDAARPPAGEGADLGLPEATASATPAPARTAKPNFLPSPLPSGFGAGASAYSSFTGGSVSALVATQREVRRLQLLSDSGRAPEWRLLTPGRRFTDQLAMLAVVDGEAERAGASAAFAEYLLSEAAQRALKRARALPVADVAPIYAGQAGMAELESAYAGGALVPNAFESAWRAEARALLGGVLSGVTSAQRAFGELEKLLG